MKVALCLQGLSVGNNDKGDPVEFLNAGKSIKSYIIDNDVDVFIHTWNTDNDSISKIKNLYKPKKSIFEKQIMFDDTNTKYHSIKSRWYSQMKSIELKKQYEKENNFTYDFVMVSRFDCMFYVNIDFYSLDYTKFYVSNWMKPHSYIGFLDYWFIANSSNMNLFGDLYNKLDEYLFEETQLSNHVLSKHHVEKLGLTDNVSYILAPGRDFELNRLL